MEKTAVMVYFDYKKFKKENGLRTNAEVLDWIGYNYIAKLDLIGYEPMYTDLCWLSIWNNNCSRIVGLAGYFYIEADKCERFLEIMKGAKVYAKAA